MKMTLSEVVADINRGKKTGILSIAIQGDDKNLFKIFFKDGDVYHLTCGAQKDSDCLGQCDTLDFLSCSFLPNAKSDAARSANLPVTSEIIRLLGAKKTLIEVLTPKGKTAPPGGQDAAASGDFARIREELKLALIRQIGPAGGKAFMKIVDEKWRVPSPTKADLQKLVGLLKEEIEDGENRTQFTRDAEKILL
jgi:hypothetical protein